MRSCEGTGHLFSLIEIFVHGRSRLQRMKDLIIVFVDGEHHELPGRIQVFQLDNDLDARFPRPFVFDLARSRPIWQNAWFVAGCLLITGGLTIWALRARHTRTNRLRQTELAKLKVIEQERSRIARDLHDDLNASWGRKKKDANDNGGSLRDAINYAGFCSRQLCRLTFAPHVPA